MEKRRSGIIKTLVIYDISDSKKRRRFAVMMESFGRRVQKSAFETSLNGPLHSIMMSRIMSFPIDGAKDSIRTYHMITAPQTVNGGLENGIWNDENDVLFC